MSCRAWTFIKPRVKRRKGLSFNLGPDLEIGIGGKRKIIPPQCRLKHSVGQRRDNECCISGVKRVAARRSENKAEKCADYSERSIAQQDRNLIQRCQYRGEKWHSNYRRHYRWCMDSPRRRSNVRIEERRADLRDCRDQRRVRNRSCDRYASTAMDIFEQARENRCLQDIDGNWKREYERLYQWCLDRGPSERKAALQRAQNKWPRVSVVVVVNVS